MNDYEALERAKAVMEAVETGAYDAELGVTADERTALDRVRSEGRIDLDDFRTLVAMGHHELAVQAHHDNRLDLTNKEN